MKIEKKQQLKMHPHYIYLHAFSITRYNEHPIKKKHSLTSRYAPIPTDEYFTHRQSHPSHQITTPRTKLSPTTHISPLDVFIKPARSSPISLHYISLRHTARRIVNSIHLARNCNNAISARLMNYPPRERAQQHRSSA